MARIGVDVGGTFTDLVLLNEAGQSFQAKVSSTPAAPEVAVLHGIEHILAQAQVQAADVVEVLHGTTVGSNTLLQKTGARCGLITTHGFHDVLEIGRVRTPTMFDLSWDKPEPLIARRWRVGVHERVLADGSVQTPVDIDEVMQAGRFFAAEGIEAVAICFINSYKNPANERAAYEAYQAAFPDMHVTASIAVLPEQREYERTSTTAVNAYLLPVLSAYLRRLQEGLQALGIRAPLLVSNSNGGLSSVRTAQQQPVFFVSSGRSAGVVGAGRLGAAIAEPDLIVFDMGGTTASASLVQAGELARTNEYEFRAGISTPSRFIKAGGYLMRVPTIDVAEVGSGAGSIAWIDAGGLLGVGPISAGADPGPVCYGAGGLQPTVTDANAVLGLLPDTLAAGSIRLDLDAARRVIGDAIGQPLKLSVEDAACGIREVVNVNMARTIKAVTVERGVDPRTFTLMAFGGSGPAHACDLAQTLGMRRVLFPNAAGVFTAMGMLAGSVERYFVKPLEMQIAALAMTELGAIRDTLRAQAQAALGEEGYPAARIEYVFELDMRFAGQDYELPIRIPDRLTEDSRQQLCEDFRRAYTAMYGYASKDAMECANVRLLARGLGAHVLDFSALRANAANPDTPAHTQPAGRARQRRAYFSRASGWVDTPVMQRINVTDTLVGPIIIESADTTIVIPPGWQAAADATGNLVATLTS